MSGTYPRCPENRKASPVKNHWAVGQEQLQDELPGDTIKQSESTSLCNELLKRQAHSTSHRTTSGMNETRNDFRDRLQQQPARPQTVHHASQDTSYKRFYSFTINEDICEIFNATLKQSRTTNHGEITKPNKYRKEQLQRHTASLKGLSISISTGTSTSVRTIIKSVAETTFW